DSFLFAEKATLRKQAVQTSEVADTVAFLLSPRSSGINAQGIVIDAGMGTNYFDDELVHPDTGTAALNAEALQAGTSRPAADRSSP
ncbi:MAG: SDR family oxidoreductase, partial [Planctomycetaceae bacterium]|nr:SDR family oxidoreductase [Planctomycetaceae bacterium]